MADSSRRPTPADEALGNGARRGGPYRTLAESLEQCVFLLNAEGRYLTVNRSFRQWLGLPEAAILGRGPFDVWPAPLAEADAADNARALAGERVEREEVRPRGRQERTVRTVKVPLRDERGAVQGVLGMFRDVTEERARQEQAAHARSLEALGRAAAGVSHDFSNLLAVILGHVSLLRHTPLSAAQLDLVEGLDRAVTQAVRVTDQLLAFARRDGRPTRPVDLGAFLSETATVLRPLLGSRVALEVRCGPDLPRVQADPAGLGQVLMNLCLNARDAMPEGGTLTLSAEAVAVGGEELAAHPDARPGTFVRLRAADTGTGIAPEVLPRVFEPFFTTKGPGKGTGLGLALVASVLRQHGGWVTCASALGQGTHFDAYLPVAPVAECALRLADLPDNPQAATRNPQWKLLPARRKTVLLIDPDPQVLQLARTLLQGHGYDVLAAEAGPAAVEAFREAADRVDLVVLDHAPAGRPFRETLDGLLAVSPGVRVVLASDYPLRDLPPELRRHLCGHLHKPFHKEQLLETVRAALARSPAVRPSEN